MLALPPQLDLADAMRLATINRLPRFRHLPLSFSSIPLPFLLLAHSSLRPSYFFPSVLQERRALLLNLLFLSKGPRYKKLSSLDEKMFDHILISGK